MIIFSDHGERGNMKISFDIYHRQKTLFNTFLAAESASKYNDMKIKIK